MLLVFGALPLYQAPITRPNGHVNGVQHLITPLFLSNTINVPIGACYWCSMGTSKPQCVQMGMLVFGLSPHPRFLPSSHLNKPVQARLRGWSPFNTKNAPNWGAFLVFLYMFMMCDPCPFTSTFLMSPPFISLYLQPPSFPPPLFYKVLINVNFLFRYFPI